MIGITYIKYILRDRGQDMEVGEYHKINYNSFNWCEQTLIGKKLKYERINYLSHRKMDAGRVTSTDIAPSRQLIA